MPEEKKEKILKVLKEFPDEKISISRISKMITEISYPTVLKWVLVLQAERKVKIDDYGNVKLVYLNKEYKE
jgi:DNA-binding transcriptional ArsR family regulator